MQQRHQHSNPSSPLLNSNNNNNRFPNNQIYHHQSSPPMSPMTSSSVGGGTFVGRSINTNNSSSNSSNNTSNTWNNNNRPIPNNQFPHHLINNNNSNGMENNGQQQQQHFNQQQHHQPFYYDMPSFMQHQQNYYQNPMMSNPMMTNNDNPPPIYNVPPYSFYDYKTIQQAHQYMSGGEFNPSNNMEANNSSSFYQSMGSHQQANQMMYNPMYPYFYPQQQQQPPYQENQSTNAKQIENELKSLLLKGGEQGKPPQINHQPVLSVVPTVPKKERVVAKQSSTTTQQPPKEKILSTETTIVKQTQQPIETTVVTQQQTQQPVTITTNKQQAATETSSLEKAPQQKKPLKNKKKDQPINFKFGAYRDDLDERMLIMPAEKLKPIDSFLNGNVTPSLLKLYNELIPTQKEIEKRNEFFQKFHQLVNNKWSDAKLYMFGSSANGLCLRQLHGKNEYCDVDFCLVLELTPDRMRKVQQQQPNTSKEQQQLLEEEDKSITTTTNSNESTTASTTATTTANNDMIEEEGAEDQQEEGEEKAKKKPKAKKKLTQEQYHKKNYVSQLKQYLETKLNYTDVKGIFSARIPIVTFTEQNLKINCDIGVNNILAVYNTRLIGLYCNIDIRCKQLIFLIKYWSKHRDINDPFGGTLSSYCLVIMVIHLLQQCEILPFLQDKTIFTNMKTNIVDGLDGHNYDCSFEESMDEINSKTTRKEDSLGVLLLKFFKYYAFEFDYENKAISIIKSEQRLISKKEGKDWSKGLFAVEDPFETEFNTARNVSIGGLEAIRYEFVRAFHLIQKQSNFKDVVCAKLSTLKI